MVLDKVVVVRARVAASSRTAVDQTWIEPHHPWPLPCALTIPGPSRVLSPSLAPSVCSHHPWPLPCALTIPGPRARARASAQNSTDEGAEEDGDVQPKEWEEVQVKAAVELTVMAKACASKGRSEVAEATSKVIDALRGEVEVHSAAPDSINGTKQGTSHARSRSCARRWLWRSWRSRSSSSSPS
jgi:hypothetical protein